MIAALYIDPRGPYPKMTDVDAWDESRDARKYEGPHPIVAHPPCGPWGILRHLYRGAQQDCAMCAVHQVRTFGGVLEHPAGSSLWPTCSLPKPGEFPDRFGGFTVEVEQVSWGHVARKRTWLYIVRADAEMVRATRKTGGTPTHWCSGSRNAPRGPVPSGIKVCSAQQRRRTPVSFAEWLVQIARTVRDA